MRKGIHFIITAMILLSSMALYAANQQAPKNNKEIVIALFKATNFKDAEKYLSSTYVEHDPTAKPGIEGVKYYLETRRTEYPDYKVDIKKVIADGNIVAVYAHEKLNPSDRGRAIVDIYKLNNGKVVEHWDVIQAIPDNANNPIGMF